MKLIVNKLIVTVVSHRFSHNLKTKGLVIDIPIEDWNQIVPGDCFEIGHNVWEVIEKGKINDNYP